MQGNFTESLGLGYLSGADVYHILNRFIQQHREVRNRVAGEFHFRQRQSRLCGAAAAAAAAAAGTTAAPLPFVWGCSRLDCAWPLVVLVDALDNLRAESRGLGVKPRPGLGAGVPRPVLRLAPCAWGDTGVPQDSRKVGADI